MSDLVSAVGCGFRLVLRIQSVRVSSCKQLEDVSDSHVAPGGDAALVHVAGQVDQLSVDVLQVEGAEGLFHALRAQGRGGAALQAQQAQQQDLQQLQTGAGR